MTTPIKPRRFRLRKSGGETRPTTDAPEPVSAQAQEDIAPQPRTAEPPALADEEKTTAPPSAVVVSKRPRQDRSKADTPPATGVDAVRAEGLTARQLRMAMRVAQKHGVRASSPYEAVATLRARGIDPFARATMLEMVKSDAEPGRALATRPESAPATTDQGDPVTTAKDRMARIAAEREKELRRVRGDIARRRRKRLLALGARLLVFVTLPTFLVTWYFYMIATPLYGTESQLIIQQADSQNGIGAMSGLLPSASGMGLGGQSEAASVQAFLQSRAAMLRLDEEEGFKAHFQQDHIDLIRRLEPDASSEEAYKLYGRVVQIGYDPTEGVVRMEVRAATPEDSERFARALIRFAEEHVDRMTQRLRDSQLGEARASLEEAQENLNVARQAVVDLQERSSVLSGEVEVSLLSQQISALETELTQTRFSLQDLRSNPRPSTARVEQLERREEALRSEIENLRGSMTRGGENGGSLARIQSELIMAEAEVQTREMMRAQAMQQLESARIEVSRQVRYLALSVAPVAPDDPTYPRKLEYSALAFLIFLGIYLFLSMTASVLREQISG